MQKKTQPAADLDWGIEAEPTTAVEPKDEVSWTTAESKTKSKKKVEAVLIDAGYDMEGLMTDFPTATELQRFVYDQTGIVLNLKGRANKVKYQVALDCLNGAEPDPQFVGSENPYVDKTEIIPEDPLKDPPARPKELEGLNLVTRFGTNTFPHPEPEWRAQDIKAQVVFRKYDNGIITYEILGPIAKKAVGSKINKFGVKQPERLTWIDPRTGEQIIRRADGSFTPLGTRLRTFMQRQRVNKSNQWDVWIDRDFVIVGDLQNDNPWGA
jgi:hypothetical protein